MLSSSPPPIDDGEVHNDWGDDDDDFGGFQDAATGHKEDFGNFATFNSVQDDPDGPSMNKSVGMKDALSNDYKVNGNISERFICDQERNIPEPQGDIPVKGHNRVASDEGFLDFQSVPESSLSKQLQSNDGDQHVDSDLKSNSTSPACDNSCVNQPAGASSETQTIDNTSQDSVTDSGLCGDMSPGAKCEDYPEFPNQKDPSHIVSPQGSKDCANTSSIATDSSIPANKKSSSDILPPENHSNSDTLTCSREIDDDSALKSEITENTISRTETDNSQSFQTVPSNSTVECSNSSEEGDVDSQNIDAITPNSDQGTEDNTTDGDGNSHELKNAKTQELKNAETQDSDDKNDKTVKGLSKSDSKEELENILNKDNETDHIAQNKDPTLAHLEEESVDPNYSDKDDEKSNEESSDTERTPPENQDSPEDEFGTFGSFRNASDLQFRQSISEDDFQEAEEDVDGFGTLKTGNEDDEDELMFKAAAGWSCSDSSVRCRRN